jgi:hypothetical protein
LFMAYSITIGESARSILHEISQQEKTSIQTVLEKAIENYRRQYVLTQTNKAQKSPLTFTPKGGYPC